MINIEPNKIFAVSVIGSILFLFWFIFSISDVTSYRVKKIFLVINIVLFFIPFPEFKNYYLDMLYLLFGYDPNINEGNITSLIHITKDGIAYNLTIRYYMQITLFCLWLVVVILFFSKQLKNYKKISEVLKNGIFAKTQYWENKVIETEIKKQNIKKDISIRKIDNIKFPTSTGFFKPTILLPNMDFTKEDFTLMIRHELIHIKQNDYIIKLLATVLVVVHWFNPIAYILLLQTHKICEFCCDEKIALELSKEERKRYGHLILRFSVPKKKRKQSYFLPVSYFGNSDKNKIKERLGEMKKATKKRKLHTVVACMAWAAAMAVSSIGVLAYQEEPRVYEEVATERVDDENVTEYFYLDDGKEKDVENFDDSDIYFTDENGIRYDISEWEEQNKTKSTCNHSYKSGTVSKHIKNSNGGCKVNDYEAQICSKCEKYILGEIYHSETYKKCPH